MTTIYRVIVMVVTGFVVFKGWQHYGPSTAQVKTFAVAAMDKARVALADPQAPPPDSATPFADPRTMSPPLAASHPPAFMGSVPAAPTAPQLVPLANSTIEPLAESGSEDMATQEPLAEEGTDPITVSLARLQEIAFADAQVGPWGASGEFYRCSCQAKMAEASPMARHFEAVASEPLAAVEQVAAKVEAWRHKQQQLLR